MVAPIHDRMPVILDRKHEDDWLDPQQHDTDFLATLLKPYPAEELEAYPVSRTVNNPANDVPQCVESVTSP